MDPCGSRGREVLLITGVEMIVWTSVRSLCCRDLRHWLRYSDIIRPLRRWCAHQSILNRLTAGGGFQL